MNFIPPFFHFNAHLQTILPSIFRKVKGVKYQGERINTLDNDFLDLDWSVPYPKSEIVNPKLRVRDLDFGLIILSHGLEGNSSRQYMQGMVKIFN